MGMGRTRSVVLVALAFVGTSLPIGSAAAAIACIEEAAPEGARVIGPEFTEPGDEETYRAEAAAHASQASRSAVPASPGVTGGEIPVHVHVIARGGSPAKGNVSDAKIDRQISVLNEGFSSTGWSFTKQTVSRKVDKQWARMAPGTAIERRVKKRFHEGDASELNLYITDPPYGLLGWATFPRRYSEKPHLDGVVVAHWSMPESGGPYGHGDTAVHEVGHWMGLYHTFQGGCSPAGDLVDDTPSEKKPAFGCPEGRDTCPGGGNDPVTNFMDYTDDKCMDHFTAGQDVRMDEQWSRYRA